jgi:hemolysin III
VHAAVSDRRSPGEAIGRVDPRYISRREFAADRWVHMLGLSLGTVGAVTIVVRLAVGADRGDAIPIVVYVIGLLAMLGCSAAYNLTPWPPTRPLLRRFDHAAIFLMIAGTYTPFMTRHPMTEWSISLTTFIWVAALVGVVAKFACPSRLERLSIVTYLALGWVGLVAIGPLTAGLDQSTIDLIFVGGLLYTIGVGFHLWHKLPFQNAIWHGLVLAAAACHFAAVVRCA